KKTRLDLSARFDFRQRGEDGPRFAISGPLIAAGDAGLDVLVSELALLGVERLRQQQRHTFSHQIAVRHRSPPLASPPSAFFSVSIARNTLVFTAPSEQPEICAISAYDRPWYRERRIASRCSGVSAVSAF